MMAYILGETTDALEINFFFEIVTFNNDSIIMHISILKIRRLEIQLIWMNNRKLYGRLLSADEMCS